MPGERYLLGGENVTLQELFARIARLAGKTPTAPQDSVRGRARSRRPPTRQQG